jgi:carbonic anhydrase/acetyltransferase-like protein (isoleucine patch superfamily)
VFDNALVFDDARVFGRAEVSGNAMVYGNAWVAGNARVFGDAWVFDNAMVFGNAQVYGDALVYGNAMVFDNAWVYGDAEVCDKAWVFGNAQVCGAEDAVEKEKVPKKVEDLIVEEQTVIYKDKNGKMFSTKQEAIDSSVKILMTDLLLRENLTNMKSVAEFLIQNSEEVVNILSNLTES